MPKCLNCGSTNIGVKREPPYLGWPCLDCKVINLFNLLPRKPLVGAWYSETAAEPAFRLAS